MLHSGWSSRRTLHEYESGKMEAVIKCAGLTPAQLRTRAVEPSGLSLLGLVQHLTEVERSWFRAVVSGENYARHNGRADLLRERLDGSTGE